MAEVEQAELSSNENGTEQLQSIPEGQEGQEDLTPEGGQELEEFEVVLGSVEEPSTEQEKVAKKPRGMKRLLNERRENKDKLTAQDARIAELEQQLAGSQQTNVQADVMQVPVMPTDEELGYDPTAIAAAKAKHNQDLSTYISNATTAASQGVYDRQQTTTQRLQEQEQHDSVINAHSDRAEKLNLPDFGEAEAALVEVLDQGAVTQIAQMVPNSEAVVYYLGKNPAAALKIRELWERNPAQVAFELGGLSKDLKIVPKRNKQRLAPESKVLGAAPASKSSLEKEIDKERERIASGETNDMTQLHRLKGQLRSASA